MLRLRPATNSAVPGGSPDLQLLPPKAKLLPDLPRPAHTEHPEPGHGESSLHSAVPLQGKTPEVSTHPSQLKLTSRWKLHFLKLLRGEGGCVPVVAGDVTGAPKQTAERWLIVPIPKEIRIRFPTSLLKGPVLVSAVPIVVSTGSGFNTVVVELKD